MPRRRAARHSIPIPRRCCRRCLARLASCLAAVDERNPQLNAVIHPLAIGGPFLTIRKFAADPFTAVDLMNFGTLDERSVRFLRACIEGRLNIIVSGGKIFSLSGPS